MATKFRTSMTSEAGHESAKICQGRVVNINLVKWTVDVNGQFDRKKYFNIQVASPYMHHANGEGISVMPEVGATCMVCIPSDTSAPFIMCFIMANALANVATADAPLGTTSHGQPAANPTDSSFAGGRPTALPGDIMMSTRDNNFVILHRGGVLQVGATELAQRIYIPLNNLIMDVSQNYEHNNAGGTIKWGIQEGPSQTNYPAQFFQTFRVFANDQYADVKITCGDITSPVGEPDGGVALAAAGVGQGNDATTASNCILFEVDVSPKGFTPESGAPNPGAVAASVMKFTFDRQGNTLYRTEGNFAMHVTKALTFDVTGGITINTGGNLSMTATNGVDIGGGPYVSITGKVVRLGPGQTPVARNGDFVTSTLTPAAAPLLVAVPIPVVGSPTGPWAIVPGTPIVLTGQILGQVTSGQPEVLV
jgi:hypothetical protein